MTKIGKRRVEGGPATFSAGIGTAMGLAISSAGALAATLLLTIVGCDKLDRSDTDCSCGDSLSGVILMQREKRDELRSRSACVYDVSWLFGQSRSSLVQA